MCRSAAIVLFIICCAIALATSGCGTVRTMPALGSYGTPQIYSGARLDLDAIREDQDGLNRFKTKPPEHPLLDLPFSAVLDTLILPVVLPVAAYVAVFE